MSRSSSRHFSQEILQELHRFRQRDASSREKRKASAEKRNGPLFLPELSSGTLSVPIVSVRVHVTTQPKREPPRVVPPRRHRQPALRGPGCPRR